MATLSPAVKNKCQQMLGTSIFSSHAIPGGDINLAFLLKTASGNFFLKMNQYPSGFSNLQSEVEGLNLLKTSKAIKIPEVIGVDQEGKDSFLILEFIESGIRTKEFWKQFGQQLANLHKVSYPTFGLNTPNFIGSLPQQNNAHTDWATFFIEERLLPQIQMESATQLLSSNDQKLFRNLFKLIPDLCPKEPPALIHGDLWSGNFMVNVQNEPILIDPSVAYSHREMDLAMARLFGGFDRLFYSAYQSYYPLALGFETRLPIYQLYYLLAHVNLFGGSYVNSVRNILIKFN